METTTPTSKKPRRWRREDDVYYRAGPGSVVAVKPIDGRSQELRAFRRLVDAFAERRGGWSTLDLLDRELIKSAALQTLNAQLAAAEMLANPDKITPEQRAAYAVEAGSLDRTLRSAGMLGRKAKDGATPADKLRAHASKVSKHGEAAE